MKLVVGNQKAYLNRNDVQKGKDPIQGIMDDIARDKVAFNKLSDNSKKKKDYSLYNFDKLDPEKIANFFRDKRGMTPYDVSKKIDFRNKESIFKSEYIKNKREMNDSVSLYYR